jgi:hypothetical protein
MALGLCRAASLILSLRSWGKYFGQESRMALGICRAAAFIFEFAVLQRIIWAKSTNGSWHMPGSGLYFGVRDPGLPQLQPGMPL